MDFLGFSFPETRILVSHRTLTSGSPRLHSLGVTDHDARTSLHRSTCDYAEVSLSLFPIMAASLMLCDFHGCDLSIGSVVPCLASENRKVRKELLYNYQDSVFEKEALPLLLTLCGQKIGNFSLCRKILSIIPIDHHFSQGFDNPLDPSV